MVGWCKEPPPKGNRTWERILSANIVCAMNDLIHYLRYIPCFEIDDVPKLWKKTVAILAEVPMVG